MVCYISLFDSCIGSLACPIVMKVTIYYLEVVALFYMLDHLAVFLGLAYSLSVLLFRCHRYIYISCFAADNICHSICCF